jgi:hypothetical protein
MKQILTLTADGYWDLLNPTPDKVNFDTIAKVLAQLPRYNAHTSKPYSVAEHSMWVAHLACEMFGKCAVGPALIHDAHEAYVGDITSPVAAALVALGAGDALERLKTAHDRAIYTAAGIAWPLPAAIREQVAQSDALIHAVEMRLLFPDHALADDQMEPHVAENIEWAIKQAEDLGLYFAKPEAVFREYLLQIL